MIRIFEGVPGSGKTYAMVYYLKKWADWDDFYREWILKDGVIVISNIEDLRIPHYDLDRLLSDLGGVREVFSEKFIKTLWDKGFKKIIFAIDEAQKYFDRKFYDKDVFFFFQYHRHYGVDILLATQDASILPKEIRVLAEFIIRAEQRSLTLNSFKYKYYSPDGNTHLFNQTLKKDEKVFSMYKSFHIEETDKPPNVLVRQLILPAIAFLLFIGFSYLYVTTFMFPKSSKSESEPKPEPAPVKQNSAPGPDFVKRSPPAPSFSFSLPLSGYARVGSTYYYFSGRYVYRDSSGSCIISPDYSLICSRSLEVWKVLPPPAPAPAFADQDAHDQGGSGLVHIRNKSHTLTPSTASLPPGGVQP